MPNEVVAFYLDDLGSSSQLFNSALCLASARYHHPTRAARAGTPVRSRFRNGRHARAEELQFCELLVQTTCVFHLPRRKTTALTIASVEKAIMIARKTPRGPMPKTMASR
jgi:hypothetical protein